MACRFHQDGFLVLGYEIIEKKDGLIQFGFNAESFAKTCNLIIILVRDKEKNLELYFWK